MKNNILAIAEWQSIHKDKIGEKYFNELVEFAQQKGNHQFLNFNGKNKLKARNFVGLIQTKSGFCVEILPKTFDTSKDDKIGCDCGGSIKKATTQNSEIASFCKKILGEKPSEKSLKIFLADKSCQVCKAKAILLNCLSTLKDSPFKQSHLSSLKAQHFPLLEVFILMFLNEVTTLIKRGIRSDYIEVSKNQNFLKGKLLFNENLKYNFIHKERFFTSSDEFSQNIAPNRLIVATLELLKGKNLSHSTSAKIKQILFIFSDISSIFI